MNKHLRQALLISVALTVIMVAVALSCSGSDNPASLSGFLQWFFGPIDYVWLDLLGNWGGYSVFFLLDVPYAFVVFFCVGSAISVLFSCRRRTLVISGGVIVAVIATLVALRTIPWGYGQNLESATEVSMSDLIAEPEKYNGRDVRVRGICALRGRYDTALYNTQRDRLRFCRSEAVWIEPDFSKLGVVSKTLLRLKVNVRTVVLEGTFDAHGKGCDNEYVGTIASVSRIRCM